MINYMIFKDETAVKPVAILVPNKDFNAKLLRDNYVADLISAGIPEEDIIAFNLHHKSNGKIGVTAAREYLEKLKPILDQVGCEAIFCADASYFKALTKATTVDKFISYRMDTLWSEQDAFYCPSFRRVMFDPEVAGKIRLACKGLANFRTGQQGMFEESVLKLPQYHMNTGNIAYALGNLAKYGDDGKLKYPVLTCDIETFSLQVDKAQLGTIAFAWNQHEGMAFPVDYGLKEEPIIKRWLKQWFERYAKRGGKLIYHGGTFDIKVLIWELFMKDANDIEGMLHGLDVMFTLFDDTKSLAYLATNSTGGNHLGLKAQAFEYVGNYALDMTDITQHSVAKVLEYNLIDACATWFVYHKHRNQVRDTVEDVYQKVFKPSMKVITQMELTGLPMNLGEILNAEHELEDIRFTALDELYSNPIIIKFTQFLRELEAEKANAKLVKLVKTADDFLNFDFNPNSNLQLQLLLYQELGFKVINKTKGGSPSSDAKTLKALLKHEQNSKNPRKDVISLITNLQHFAEVDILLNTFIPAFKDKSVDKDGWRFLLGNFNLGGTKSGRLSSSDPNLQNIPSTGGPDSTPSKRKLVKAIKKCFQAPPRAPDDPYGCLFVGADYFSLEDRISALLTKDPNKLKVYTDGYDGHCLRAYSYFSARMPDITKALHNVKTSAEEVHIINSIKKKYPDLRQLSKGPTFALTYMGTYRTLVKNFGIEKAQAIMIDKQYHKLYGVSDAWVWTELEKANKLGYIELAFGLRLYTPMLPKVVMSSYDNLPWEAYKEMKTAGNALGQSYGLLNSFSANMFMERVWEHPKYRTWIRPCAQIHDSQYYLLRNHLGCLKWMNDNLVECMEWADLEPIKHPTVGLGAELEVYYPDWSNPIAIPNQASLTQIKEILNG